MNKHANIRNVRALCSQLHNYIVSIHMILANEQTIRARVLFTAVPVTFES